MELVLTLPHLPYIRKKDARLAETLKKLQDEINSIHTQDGSANVAPPTIGSLTVTASNGFFSVLITDHAGSLQDNLGLHYFAEWSTDKNFVNPGPTVEDLGPSRGEYIFIGNLTTYWRCYSQFRNSLVRSPFVYFGSPQNPTAVVGGGAAGGTPPGGGSGSSGGGGGFGGGGGGRGFNRL